MIRLMQCLGMLQHYDAPVFAAWMRQFFADFDGSLLPLQLLQLAHQLGAGPIIAVLTAEVQRRIVGHEARDIASAFGAAPPSPSPDRSRLLTAATWPTSTFALPSMNMT